MGAQTEMLHRSVELILKLNLECCVTDVKVVLCHFDQIAEDAHGFSRSALGDLHVGGDEVALADLPDMEIMQTSDVLHRFQFLLQPVRIDGIWHVHHDLRTNAPHCTNGGKDDQHCEGQSTDRIRIDPIRDTFTAVIAVLTDVKRLQPDEQTGDHDADTLNNVSDDVNHSGLHGQRALRAGAVVMITMAGMLPIAMTTVPTIAILGPMVMSVAATTFLMTMASVPAMTAMAGMPCFLVMTVACCSFVPMIVSSTAASLVAVTFLVITMITVNTMTVMS